MAIRRGFKIGTAESIGKADGWSQTVDDRQELVQTVGGVIVEDYGRVENGDKYSCTCVFDADGYATVNGYWTGRVKVNVEMPDGQMLQNVRVLIKSIAHHDVSKYYKLELEFWRV